jgi:hypothetical protein
MKGKALRRALETTDAVRVNADVPLITDRTELIGPKEAEELLKRNKSNRPVNWRKVEEYADIMANGKWKLHSQGIILDSDGNLLTGQQRLWAIVYSGTAVYLRVSRGNLKEIAPLIDRGRPQSARDLASRATEKRHSPMEASLARAILALGGNLRPTIDQLGETIAQNSVHATAVLRETVGTKKTKALLMILGAICSLEAESESIQRMARLAEQWADRLERESKPVDVDHCWGKGAGFALAMHRASQIVKEGIE